MSFNKEHCKSYDNSMMESKANNTKQCISCNKEMPVSRSSCVCGHVLSDIKCMEGKRYSGYREELYSRLEIRRILEDAEKPKKTKLKQKSPAKHHAKLPASSKQDLNGVIHKHHMKRKRRKINTHMALNKRDNSYQIKPCKLEENPDLWYLNPRFNFKDALDDINKRLTSQTSFWISL